MGLLSVVDAQAVARHHNLLLSFWAPPVIAAQADLACDELLGRILALAGEVLVLGHPLRRWPTLCSRLLGRTPCRPQPVWSPTIR